MQRNKEAQDEKSCWTGYRMQCLLSSSTSTTGDTGETEDGPEPRQGHVMVELPTTTTTRRQEDDDDDDDDERVRSFFLFGGRGSSAANKKPWKEMTKQERQLGKKKQRRYLNDTWILEFQEQSSGTFSNPQWQRIVHNMNEGDNHRRPSPRWSAAGFFYENEVYLHGGRNLDGFLDDLWKFSLSSRRWEKVETTLASSSGAGRLKRIGNNNNNKKSTKGPPPVNGHSLVRHKDKAYLFGGSCSYGRDRNYLGVTYVLDLHTFQWTILSNPSSASKSSSPSPRYWHSVTNVVDDCFYLVGGFAFTEDANEELYFNDVWKFNTEQKEWTQIDEFSGDGGGFSRRNRCGAAIVESSSSCSTMVVHGGNYLNSSSRGDTFLSTVSLIKMMDQQTTLVSKVDCKQGRPLSVGHHTFLPIRGGNQPSFLVFGGENGVRRFNDVLILTLF